MGIFGNDYIIETSAFKKGLDYMFKIKPHQDLAESAKKGSYPGLLNFVQKCKNIDEIEDVKKDCKYLNFTAIKERIANCKDGENASNFKYYKKIKKIYLDKGVTEKDIEKYEKWIKDVLIPACNDRIKELKKK